MYILIAAIIIVSGVIILEVCDWGLKVFNHKFKDYLADDRSKTVQDNT